MKKEIATIGLCSTLALSGSELLATESISMEQPSSLYPLSFIQQPETNFIAGTCHEYPDSWIGFSDNEPAEPLADPYHLSTIGMSAETTPEGKPIFAAGVTMQKLGDYSWKLAISDGTITEINLQDAAYATVLTGEAGYDVVFSARLSPIDNKAYFWLNCLPDAGFHGNMEETPLAPDPNTPEQEPAIDEFILV